MCGRDERACVARDADAARTRSLGESACRSASATIPRGWLSANTCAAAESVRPYTGKVEGVCEHVCELRGKRAVADGLAPGGGRRGGGLACAFADVRRCGRARMRAERVPPCRAPGPLGRVRRRPSRTHSTKDSGAEQATNRRQRARCAYNQVIAVSWPSWDGIEPTSRLLPKFLRPNRIRPPSAADAPRE